MSVSTVGGTSPLWQWQNQATATASTQAKGRAIANTDTASAAGSPGAFRQSLPADVQSLLGSDIAPPPTAPADAINQTASTKPSGAAHHQHHPHQHKGGGSDPFTHSGSAFAADITQAMQAYRSRMPSNPIASTLA